MCGIAGIINTKQEKYNSLAYHLKVMNDLQAHRGPDGHHIWVHEQEFIGFAHRRLSIIDLDSGDQPMKAPNGNWITYNGEIYNYIELRDQLGKANFKTTSDTEVILKAYEKWGEECVNHLRGMFAFVIWDEQEQKVFCARDRFGIKPFYYAQVDDKFYFASEVKSLLPFLPEMKTDLKSLKDYFVFQLCLDNKTLFDGVQELLPAHCLSIKNQNLTIRKYWEVYYNIDFSHSAQYFVDHLRELVAESVKFHIRSDVPVGSYISGGVDSSSIASLASDFKTDNEQFMGFIGKFAAYGNSFDETNYARSLAKMKGIDLKEIDINSQDFIDNIRKVIYHLDYPVAGPGSFPQYMVSSLAAQHRKVVLGGQGGDEIFGGYVRYLIAYFEQCMKGAIEGTLTNGNYVVTYESIIPNLKYLKNYKPLFKKFFSKGLFESLDKRYFRLINRAPDLTNEVNWDLLGDYQPFESFEKIFHGENVQKSAYFDSMTHFDFKTLLPGLLQVEDRMSMAHGLESRVPLLDHKIVEFAATIPADIKFKDGKLKKTFINSVKDTLPPEIVNREDKMGFPVPLSDWLKNDANDFVMDIFTVQKAKNRPIFNTEQILNSLKKEAKFARNIWGMLSLELWHQEFHDKSAYYKNLIK